MRGLHLFVKGAPLPGVALAPAGEWAGYLVCARMGATGPHRLTVRTPLFQGGDRGSIPREGAGG